MYLVQHVNTLCLYHVPVEKTPIPEAGITLFHADYPYIPMKDKELWQRIQDGHPTYIEEAPNSAVEEIHKFAQFFPEACDECRDKHLCHCLRATCEYVLRTNKPKIPR